MELWVKWVLGLFVVPVVTGHFIIYNLIIYFRKRYKFPAKRMETTILLGCLERFIFTVSFVLGHEGFIAFWLGVKIVSRWSPEGNVPEQNLTNEQKLDAINIFLMGNLLSIAFSFIGAWIIKC